MRRRVVIVGAGPAGMSAAVVAAEAGLEPLVLDEQPRVGGQIYRQPPPAMAAKAAASRSASSQRGRELLQRFRALADRMIVLTGTAVWGVFPPRRLAVSNARGWQTIDAEQLILAPGAYEYVPPFPGWTLPGVMTPGGAQHLAKTMGVLPGKCVLLAGSGPFLLVVAEQLHLAGMEVVGVVEAGRTGDFLRALPGMLAEPSLFLEGLGYLGRLRKAGIPVHRGQVVVEARGHRELQEVVIASCDRGWRPDRSRARSMAVDTLCVGYGFVPRTQLAQLAGCRMKYADELGGWIPVVDADLQTSVPGIFVAGDGGGVAGALAAQDSGTLAGLAACRQLGALDDDAFARARRPVVERIRRLQTFRAALDRISRIRPGLSTLAHADTIVCRCEELTRAEVEQGVAFGGTNLRSLKVMTRLGMGPCQGCVCWPAAARWLSARTGSSMEEIGPLSVRPPVTPLTLGELAREPSAWGDAAPAAAPAHEVAS